MSYEVLLAFDIGVTDTVTSRKYFQALEKYNATGMGHERTMTSSMFIPGPLNIGELTRDLEGIAILSIR